MWRVYKEAGRPWPVLSQDPAIDYMVMEADFLRVQEEERQAQKDAERKEWKKQQMEQMKQYT